MKNLKKFSILALITFALACASTLNAQNKAGTTVGQFLKIEPSSRAVAIGNAGTALFGEATSMFFNPASLGRLEGTDVQFTYNKWLADITYNYAVAAVNLPSIGSLSLQLTNLNSGEIAVRTVEQPLGTGEKYKVTDLAIGLGYGVMLTDRVSVGLQLNYITETIWHSSMSMFGMNFGVQYQLSESGIMLGASVSNFGTKGQFSGRDLFIDYDFDPKKYGDNDELPAEFRTDSYSLPTIFRVGVALPYKFSEDYSLLISADAMHPSDNRESVNIGGEFTLMKMLFLRGGYRNLFLQDSNGGLVFGGGVKTELAGNISLRFDYAYADYGRLAEAHRLTIGMGLR